MKSRVTGFVASDDILILVPHGRSGKNALTEPTGYLEGDLKLTVKPQQTQSAHTAAKYPPFLGSHSSWLYCDPAWKKLKGLKAKLKWMTRRNCGKIWAASSAELNPVLRGFIKLLQVTNCTR